MKTKQSEILNNMENAGKPVRSINGSAKPKDKTATNASEVINPDALLLLSLQKAEENNAHLEELLEDSRKKQTDAVAENARFLKIVAHDLRNPFSTTIGILDLLKESLDDWTEAEIKQFINIASNSANQALDLLENLLAWSMSQNSEIAFNPIKINLRELVVTEIERFSTSAALKHIGMDQSIDHNILVTGDFEMIKTIFRNLITNAIKYTPTGGDIYITATEGKKFAKIEVRDNGIGMSERTKEKLFKIDAFSSMPGTDNEMGSGLGLLFCKEFIDLHGGKIKVESEPGKGSRVKFTLPHYI